MSKKEINLVKKPDIGKYSISSGATTLELSHEVMPGGDRVPYKYFTFDNVHFGICIGVINYPPPYKPVIPIPKIYSLVPYVDKDFIESVVVKYDDSDINYVRDIELEVEFKQNMNLSECNNGQPVKDPNNNDYLYWRLDENLTQNKRKFSFKLDYISSNDSISLIISKKGMDVSKPDSDGDGKAESNGHDSYLTLRFISL